VLQTNGKDDLIVFFRAYKRARTQVLSSLLAKELEHLDAVKRGRCRQAVIRNLGCGQVPRELPPEVAI